MNMVFIVGNTDNIYMINGQEYCFDSQHRDYGTLDNSSRRKNVNTVAAYKSIHIIESR